MENQTQNSPIMYPARIYDGKGFIPNAGREQSSDNLTTVMTDNNEVLGFQDGTSQQEMEHAIFADRNGSISEYKPTFYDKYLRKPLEATGMDMFQPKFITDIKPTPERAFATSMARAATADVFKPNFSDQEAKAYPTQAFAGGLVGSVAAFATGGALLDGWKLSQLTPFAENIIKGGILGGAYRGASETSNELRDEDHPDLAKIGKAVLHDTLWWGGISGIVGQATKPVGVAASAGLGYLMAKSDGADEPTALLNGSVLAGFHLFQSHGDQPEVRKLITDNLQKNVADYISAKNPAVHEIVADRAGQEFVLNHVQDAIEQENALLVPEQAKTDVPKDTGIETPEAKAIEQIFQRPEKPIEDGYDPHLLNYLSQYIPVDRLVRMSGTDRVALGKNTEADLQEYKRQHEQTVKDIEAEKATEKGNITNDIDRMVNEGGNISPIEELVNSKTLLNKVMKNVAKQVILKEGGENASQGEESVESGSGKETPYGKAQAGVHLRDTTQRGMETKAGEEVIPSEETASAIPSAEQGKKSSGIAKSIEAKAIEQGLTKIGYAELAGYDSSTIKEQSELASKFTIDQIKEIATGREPLPKGMKPATALSIAEDHATATKDAQLAMDLARSPLATQISEGASALSLSRMRTPDSATAKIRELNKLKEQKSEKASGGKKPEVIKKQIRNSLEKAIEKAKPSKKDWASFLESIKC